MTPGLALIEAFRKDDEKVKVLRGCLEDPVFREAMAILKANGRENDDPNVPSPNADSSDKILGQIQGFNRYPNLLLYMATYPKELKKVKDDYKEGN